MKKAIAVFVCVILVTGLCACGSEKTDDTDMSSSGNTSETESVNSEDGQTESAAGSADTSSEEETAVDAWRTHPENYKLIALTYDDAPSFSDITDNPTVRIIDTINSYEGRGTLFVVGKTLMNNGNSLLRYAAEKGFELGNHTYSHQSVSTSEVGKNWTALENYEDFKRCGDLVEKQMGIKMKYLRPAGVHTNEALYEAASSLGLPCISGNCKRAVSDYSSETTADMIVERVLENAFDGAIILLHGTNDRTADATARLCEILYNDGYRFCTVDELFKFKGVDYNNLPMGVMLYGVDPETGEPITENQY